MNFKSKITTKDQRCGSWYKRHDNISEVGTSQVPQPTLWLSSGNLLEVPEGVAEMLQSGDAALGKDSPSIKNELNEKLDKIKLNAAELGKDPLQQNILIGKYLKILRNTWKDSPSTKHNAWCNKYFRWIDIWLHEKMFVKVKKLTYPIDSNNSECYPANDMSSIAVMSSG